LVEFQHFDIQSTGQKSHCVNTFSGHHNALFLLNSRTRLPPTAASRRVATGRPVPHARPAEPADTYSTSADHDTTATTAFWPLRKECSRSRSVRYAEVPVAAPVTLHTVRGPQQLPGTRQPLPLRKPSNRSGHHRRALRKCTPKQPFAVDNEAESTRRRRLSRSDAESTPGSDFVVLPVCLQTVSRPVELSLQSSLQLSLTVLVCYRSRSHI